MPTKNNSTSNKNSEKGSETRVNSIFSLSPTTVKKPINSKEPIKNKKDGIK